MGSLNLVMRETFTSFIIGMAMMFAPLRAEACPLVDDLPDFNCDGKALIVVLGDSLVSGVGDTEFRDHGGYVLRAQRAFTSAKIRNLGKPGETTQRLVLALQRAFASRKAKSGSSVRRSALADPLWDADLVVLDLGRNDKWLNVSPSTSLRNLKRIRSLIERETTETSHPSPMVVTARLILPKRSFQAPWVKELNTLIRKADTRRAPTDLRFDTVSTSLLHRDRLHPTSRGYAAIAAKFVHYLKTKYQIHAHDLRPDRDHDGLYDLFEPSRFGTSPATSDTDNDGIPDGQDESPSL
jgi:lysophospholipase L1-like esterase